MKLNYGDAAARKVSERIAEAVATIALMTAIPADRRVDKMVILAAGDLYRFDSSATAGGAGTHAPDAGTGAWIKLGSGASDYLNDGQLKVQTYGAHASVAFTMSHDVIKIIAP